MFKRAWNGLLQVMNISQFLSNISVVSSRFLSEGYSIPQTKEVITLNDDVMPHISEDTVIAYRELQEFVLEEALPVLTFALESELAVPEAGFEMCDTDGQVSGMAELAWPDIKVALLLDDEPLEPFKAANWKVTYLSQIKNKEDLNKLFI